MSFWERPLTAVAVFAASQFRPLCILEDSDNEITYISLGALLLGAVMELFSGYCWITSAPVKSRFLMSVSTSNCLNPERSNSSDLEFSVAMRYLTGIWRATRAISFRGFVKRERGGIACSLLDLPAHPALFERHLGVDKSLFLA